MVEIYIYIYIYTRTHIYIHKSIKFDTAKDGIITDTTEITKKHKRVQQTIMSIKFRTRNPWTNAQKFN